MVDHLESPSYVSVKPAPRLVGARGKILICVPLQIIKLQSLLIHSLIKIFGLNGASVRKTAKHLFCKASLENQSVNYHPHIRPLRELEGGFRTDRKKCAV